MNGMEQADWSDWHISNNKGGKKQVASLSVGMSRTCQTLIRAYALTNMSKNEKEQFQAQIAMQYFTIGTSFHQVQGMHWKTAIKLLYPKDNVLPSQKQLASTLLDKCHQELQSKVNLHMKGATFCLTCDVWSNIKSYYTMSYMEASMDCCLFLEFVSIRQQGCSHQCIAGDISHIVCCYMAHQQHLQAQHARSMQSWSQPAYIIMPQSEEHSI